jgi:hypothetical protein
MDIPVSRLNQRMALQLPSELPLGMVFVVGIVEGKEHSEAGDNFGYFFLVEKRFRVRCLLSEHTTSDTEFVNGDRIRAGGHLAFDPQQAHYYLLARDIEILQEVDSEEPSGSAIMADIDRRSEETGLVPAELPVWVKQLAPPELMEELGISVPDESDDSDVEQDDSDQSDPLRQRTDGAMLSMSDELINFLSMAMDSADEVELTPEVIAHLGTPNDPEEVLKESDKPERIETEAAEWLADLEAVNEVLEEEESVEVDDKVDRVEAEETSAVLLEDESSFQPEFEDILDSEVVAKKNGSGIVDIDQEELVSETPFVEERPAALDTSLAVDLDTGFEMGEELDISTEEKSSTPWPEIIVVLLILIALILSFAVVWVVAAR